uniref:biotin/lipoyl-binding protein n=1 Tax=Methylobacterium goesingense TaxID=243690 RepID=UPI0024B4F58F
MRERERRRLPIVPVIAPWVVILALCGCKPSATDPTTPGAETPPMDVSTVTVVATTIPRILDLPGRLASTRVAEVRAQVSGIIQQRTFEEGSLVGKGDVLFQIDPAIYRAELDARTAASPPP